jgi:hypothetical protein
VTRDLGPRYAAAAYGSDAAEPFTLRDEASQAGARGPWALRAALDAVAACVLMPWRALCPASQPAPPRPPGCPPATLAVPVKDAAGDEATRLVSEDAVEGRRGGRARAGEPPAPAPEAMAAARAVAAAARRLSPHVLHVSLANTAEGRVPYIVCLDAPSR